MVDMNKVVEKSEEDDGLTERLTHMPERHT